MVLSRSVSAKRTLLLSKPSIRASGRQIPLGIRATTNNRAMPQKTLFTPGAWTPRAPAIHADLPKARSAKQRPEQWPDKRTDAADNRAEDAARLSARY